MIVELRRCCILYVEYQELHGQAQQLNEPARQQAKTNQVEPVDEVAKNAIETTPERLPEPSQGQKRLI